MYIVYCSFINLSVFHKFMMIYKTNRKKTQMEETDGKGDKSGVECIGEMMDIPV
jgi:hypothetical protein